MSKILVIEDIVDSANLAKKILTRFGHEALIALTGEEALGLASTGDIDLVLLDLGLPDVDGQTLLGMLRRDYGMENTPIVVCTAWPADVAKNMMESYGFDDFISKPYKVNDFMDVINQHIE